MIEKVFCNQRMKSFIPEIKKRIKQCSKKKDAKCKDEQQENSNVDFFMNKKSDAAQ
jgi:hypothetical protein